MFRNRFKILTDTKTSFLNFLKKILENKRDSFYMAPEILIAEFLSCLRTKSVEICVLKVMQDTMQTVSIRRQEFLRKCANIQPALERIVYCDVMKCFCARFACLLVSLFADN